MSSQNIQLLKASFNLPLKPEEIQQWRGAFVQMIGREFDDRFHNHNGDEGYHYRYPLILYRVWKNHASILALNEGIQSLQEALVQSVWELNWKKEPYQLQLTNLHTENYELRMLPNMKQYKLKQWMGLSQNNYAEWEACKSLAERAMLLERILVGHILRFCGAMDWRIEEQLHVYIQDISRIQTTRRYHSKLLTFDLTFDANIDLPSSISLGKSISRGFGELKTAPTKTRN